MQFSVQMLPVLSQSLHDEAEEVRSNAAFAVGVLCQYGGDHVAHMLSDVMGELFATCIQTAGMVGDRISMLRNNS